MENEVLNNEQQDDTTAKEKNIYIIVAVTFITTLLVSGAVFAFLNKKQKTDYQNQISNINKELVYLKNRNKSEPKTTLNEEDEKIITTEEGSNKKNGNKDISMDIEKLELFFNYPSDWKKEEKIFEDKITIALHNMEEKYYLEGDELEPIIIKYYKDNGVNNINKYISGIHSSFKNLLQEKTSSIAGQTAYSIKGVIPPIYHDYLIMFYDGYIIELVNNSEIIGKANFNADIGVKQKNEIQKVFNKILDSLYFVEPAESIATNYDKKWLQELSYQDKKYRAYKNKIVEVVGEDEKLLYELEKIIHEKFGEISHFVNDNPNLSLSPSGYILFFDYFKGDSTCLRNGIQLDTKSLIWSDEIGCGAKTYWSSTNKQVVFVWNHNDTLNFTVTKYGDIKTLSPITQVYYPSEMENTKFYWSSEKQFVFEPNPDYYDYIQNSFEDINLKLGKNEYIMN